MRLVVDTNVFVSAALKESSWPGNTVRWIDRFGDLLKTSVTEQEVMEVLRRPRIAPKIAPFFLGNVRRMFAAAELVTITEPVTGCRDPDDDKSSSVDPQCGFLRLVMLSCKSITRWRPTRPPIAPAARYPAE
jgi:predicted nucleic acid-binding protein